MELRSDRKSNVVMLVAGLPNIASEWLFKKACTRPRVLTETQGCSWRLNRRGDLAGTR